MSDRRRAGPGRGSESGGDEFSALAHDLARLAGLAARDAGRLVGQHAELLRAELRENLGGVAPSAAALAAGVGLAAAGGAMGTFMLVHGLRRVSGLPVWACYGLVGGALTAAGAGLAARGARGLAGARLVPVETVAALREDVEWLKNHVPNPSS